MHQERVLCDMDGVVANFYGGVTAAWRKAYPKEFFVPAKDLRHFYIKEAYPERLRERLVELYCRPGLFLNLPLIPGAREGMRRLLRRVGTVQLCTTPIPESLVCMDEKREWTLKHFGPALADSIIFAADKTLHPGRFLIDDRAEIPSAQKPTWEHILFAAPHNRHVTDRTRFTWKTLHENFSF